MIRWLAKLFFSNSLDHPKSLSEFWARQLTRRPELQEFAESACQVDALLKAHRSDARPARPPRLHTEIMAALRDAQLPCEPRSFLRRPGWAMAAALAAFALTVGIAAWNWRSSSSVNAGGGKPSAPSAPVLSLAATWALAEQMADRTSSPALTHPLAQEMDNLRLDLEQTTSYLLASLP